MRQSQSSEWPSVSIGIPSRPDSKYLPLCLSSIKIQDYPGKVEVKVITEGTNPEPMKMQAFKETSGEIFFYLDDDNELNGKDWLRQMVKPLMDDPLIIGSFTKHLARRSDPAVIRYLSKDALQRDPMLLYFSVKLEDNMVWSQGGYTLCTFKQPPPIGLCLYRRADIQQVIDSAPVNEARFFDIDLTATFVEMGRNLFAYVPIGQYHHHAEGLLHLTKKRIIHVRRGFLKTYPERKFNWATSPKKLVLWTIWANLFLPELVGSLYKAAKQKDWVMLYEAPVTLLLTDAAIYAFLSEPKGRGAIRNMMGL